MYAKVNNIDVVPYIGTWIETIGKTVTLHVASVVPYIGTWIETECWCWRCFRSFCRTLYRYVD